MQDQALLFRPHLHHLHHPLNKATIEQVRARCIPDILLYVHIYLFYQGPCMDRSRTCIPRHSVSIAYGQQEGQQEEQQGQQTLESD